MAKKLLFIADGGETTTATSLFNNEINSLTRDGLQYGQVNDTPVGQQFVYDPTTGIVTYDPLLPAFEANEQVIIDYEFDIPDDVITGVLATSITSSSATIIWNTSVEADSKVTYWTVTNSEFVTSSRDLVLNHSLTLTGLSAGSNYTFNITSVDTNGNVYEEDAFTFSTTGSTPPPDTTPPVVSAISSSVTDVDATIVWTTDEPATSKVEYGLTTSYGSTSTIDNTLLTAHSVAIGGLTQSTLYHYRIKSTDASGNLTTTSDHTLTTNATSSGTTLFGVILVQSGLTTTANIDYANDNTNGMGVSYWRGAHIGVADYNGQKSNAYSHLKSKGMYWVPNFNWNTVANQGQFASNQTTYQSQLNAIMGDFGYDTSVVKCIVIENEPTNFNYYNDSMEHYLLQLGWAIDTIHSYTGCKVADGCMHITPILQVRQAYINNGNGNGLTGIAKKVDTILTGINNLRIAGKVLDYCNMHTPVSANSPATNDVKVAAQYVRTRTGITNIIMNEFTFLQGDGARGTFMINECKAANLKIAIPFGGECPHQRAYPFNCGTGGGSRTPLGTAIKNAF